MVAFSNQFASLFQEFNFSIIAVSQSNQKSFRLWCLANPNLICNFYAHAQFVVVLENMLVKDFNFAGVYWKKFPLYKESSLE